MDCTLSDALAEPASDQDARVHKFAVILGEGNAPANCASAVRFPGLIRLTRNEVVHSVTREHVASAPEPVTAVDEVWCAGAPPQEALAALRMAYAGMPVVQICLVHERTIFAREDDRSALVKRISLLQRKQPMTRQQFSSYWHDVHASMAACHRHVARYVQNHVIDGACAGDRFDGIAEFQITDLAGMQADYDTEAGKAMRADVQNFAATVSTYVVSPHDAFRA